MTPKLPPRLQEEEDRLFRIERTPFKWHRRCAPCTNAQCGLCTDPFGDRQHCYCFSENAAHRLIHEQWLPDSHAEEPEHDGGLGSRVAVNRWEYEQERHEEAIR